MSQIYGGEPKYRAELNPTDTKKVASYVTGDLSEAILPGERSMESILTGIDPSLAESFGPDRTDYPESPFFAKQAAVKEEWEILQDKELEINAFARDLKRQFPNEAFTKPETMGKLSKWVDQKSQGDVQKAKDIMTRAGVISEIQVEVLQTIDAAKKEKNQEKMSKETDQKDPWKAHSQPHKLLRERESADVSTLQVRGSDTKAVKKVVGEYGLKLDSETLCLWKKGELLKEIPTQDLGGFEIVAGEISAIDSASDLTVFFGKDVLQRQSWFKEDQDPRIQEVRKTLYASGIVESPLATIYSDGKGDFIVAAEGKEHLYKGTAEDELKAIAHYLTFVSKKGEKLKTGSRVCVCNKHIGILKLVKGKYATVRIMNEGKEIDIQAPVKEVKAAPFTYNDPMNQYDEYHDMTSKEFEKSHVEQFDKDHGVDIGPVTLELAPVEADSKCKAAFDTLIEYGIPADQLSAEKLGKIKSACEEILSNKSKDTLY